MFLTEKQKTAVLEFLLIAILSLFLLSVLLAVAEKFTLEQASGGTPGDHTYYMRMATQGPARCLAAPYCYRLLQPLIAGVLPFDLQTNFLLVTVLCLWFTGVALYYLLKSYNLGATLCGIGVVLFFSLGWAVGFLLFYFWVVEGMVFLLATLAIYCIRVKKDLAFALLLVVGVATKETILAIVPLYYSLSASRLWDGKLASRTVLLSLPAIVALAVIRYTVPVGDGYDMWEWFLSISQARSEGTVDTPMIFEPVLGNSLASAIILGNVATFGVTLTLPFLDARRNLGLFVRYLPFIVLVNAQLLIAEATERLLIYAFAPFVLMCLYGLRAISRKLEVAPSLLLFLPVGLFVVTLQGRAWAWAFFNYQAIVLMGFVTLLLIAAVVKTRRVNSQQTFT